MENKVNEIIQKTDSQIFPFDLHIYTYIFKENELKFILYKEFKIHAHEIS